MSKYLDEDGLRYLWSKIQNRMEDFSCGYLNINLSTNQPGGGVTTTVKVIVDGTPTEYQYNNSPLTIPIKGGSNFSIELGHLDIDHYYTPIDANTYTMEAMTTMNLSYVYKAGLLKFKFTPSNAFGTLNIYNYNNGSSSSVTVYNNDEILIPFNDNYERYLNFAPATLDGYVKPSIGLIPITESNTIELTWTPANGVYIMDLNGNLYDVDSWAGGSNATGVALITDDNQIVIAPTYSEKRMGGYGLENAIPGSYTSTDGFYHTCQILNFTENFLNAGVTGSPAAEYCRDYSRGMKKAWYLPSWTEASLIFDNKTKIITAFDKIGSGVGGLLTAGGILTSHTIVSMTNYQTLVTYYAYNGQSAVSRTSSYEVLPICQLENKIINIWLNIKVYPWGYNAGDAFINMKFRNWEYMTFGQWVNIQNNPTKFPEYQDIIDSRFYQFFNLDAAGNCTIVKNSIEVDGVNYGEGYENIPGYSVNIEPNSKICRAGMINDIPIELYATYYPLDYDYVFIYNDANASSAILTYSDWINSGRYY